MRWSFSGLTLNEGNLLVSIEDTRRFKNNYVVYKLLTFLVGLLLGFADGSMDTEGF